MVGRSGDGAGSGVAKRLRRGLLLTPILLPFLALFIVEFFIDPFPNSLWLLRILNTNYLVHVRADLTVDGEPLVMERTFRCFDPVDYYWYPSSHPKTWTTSTTGQTGDIVAGRTASGRTFAFQVDDLACHYFIRLKPGEPEQRTYTKGEISLPTLYEFDKRTMEEVKAYLVIRPDGEQYGGHITLHELSAERTKPQETFWRDWNGYDFFGVRDSWFRTAQRGMDDEYYHSYLMVWPSAIRLPQELAIYITEGKYIFHQIAVISPYSKVPILPLAFSSKIYSCSQLVNKRPVVCDSKQAGILRYRKFLELGKFSEAYSAEPSFFVYEDHKLQQTKSDQGNYRLQTSEELKVQYISMVDKTRSFIWMEK